MKHTLQILIATSLGLLVFGCAQPQSAVSTPPAPEPVREVLTAEAQAALTPEQVLADLKEGNERFVAGKLTPRDYLAQAEDHSGERSVPESGDSWLRGLASSAGDHIRSGYR